MRVSADESVAEMLKQRVRVLIWVMTSPQSLRRARAVKKTWGTKCDLLLFFSSANNTEIPTIGLDVKEGREHLFGKTAKAFDYIYENYFPLADWFMKVGGYKMSAISQQILTSNSVSKTSDGL